MEKINEFYSKINGSTFVPNGQQNIAKLRAKDILFAIREPENKFDTNAIRIEDSEGNKLGYLPKDTSANLSPQIDSGLFITVIVSEVTGTTEKNVGCNVLVTLFENEK